MNPTEEAELLIRTVESTARARVELAATQLKMLAADLAVVGAARRHLSEQHPELAQTLLLEHMTPHLYQTPTEPRKPYTAPVLRSLGSVNALTHGSGGVPGARRKQSG